MTHTQEKFCLWAKSLYSWKYYIAMLVQYYYPFSLSPSRLDRYLAAGWFRNSVMLFRSKLLCMEGCLYDVVNIRLDLRNYEIPKRLRKLYNRNSQRFTYRINRASVSEEKNRLYALHKHRFKGFIYLDLNQFLYSDTFSSVFNTYEVEIYDGNKLVALSYFDKGEKSIASLLGIYDPDYARYSLGTFTMLLEIKHALEDDYHYFYPGYVFSQPSVFDYKLKFGDFDYYDWHGKWKPLDSFTPERSFSELLYERIEHISGCMEDMQIPYERVLYPLFPLGYMEKTIDPFVRGPILLKLGRFKGHTVILEFLPEENVFILANVSDCPEYDHLIQRRHNKSERQETVSVLKYHEIFKRDSNPFAVIEHFERHVRPGMESGKT